MDLSRHLSELVVNGRTIAEKPLSSTEVESVELLSVAIRAAVDLAAEEQHAEPLREPEGVRWSQAKSVWEDLLPSSSGNQSSAESDAVATQALVAYALEASNGDSALYDSTIARVTECLQNSQSSPEELSIVLAETLGFDQLDLVQDIVQNRKQVLQQLTNGGLHAHDDKPDIPSATHGQSNGAASSSMQALHDTHSTSHMHAGASSSSKPYTPGSSLVVQTREEKEELKKRRAEQRRLNRARGHLRAHDEDDDGGDFPLTEEEMAVMRAQSLQAATERPLFSSDRTTADQPKYPHVFTSNNGGNVLNAFGARFALPAGTQRLDHDFYEEVTIPPPKQLPMRMTERLIPIAEMDPMAKGAFPGYATLNRLQSVVFPLGYGSNENLLVCAPTGAGKTDVAMLTVLRAIKQHATGTATSATNEFGIKYDDFKIIYVAPMKALASEVVAKFSKRLRYLGVKVRELTGDMQMTRKEIAETQMIVTTPEKWDVVTRKPTGEGELAQKVKLLIIDEVHLLHEERGAVIETIVARTLRLVESSQSLIRIVGLSATLPNYVDVADFLRVNRYQGLFFFDSSFRPVPLEQHFLGVRGKANAPATRQKMEKATFEKLDDLLQQGHQVMIFVHARKETVKTAFAMHEMCRDEGLQERVLESREQGNPNAFRREIMESRNRELKELFEKGFGIHHAGMLRKDRNLSERLFEAGVTRVLCCTATLAWGVNLPAYAVLIKGTDIYDASLGRFSDLSILDVLQIFGRAGRPQYEKVGVGYIVTSHDKLTHYVDAITSQHPIESHFKTGMIDALNAECSLGSVNSIDDGVKWLSYTYLFTRMRRNPLQYGMVADEVADDPQLGAKRLHEITSAAKYLRQCKMMEMDEASGQLSVTELGRIAARYYITYKTIEIFNDKLRNNMAEADLLSVFGQATDFDQILPRENEIQELKKLQEKVPCEISGALETSSGKANLLLQAFISRLYIDDFALVSDSAYVAQNAGRVMRALFETALSKRWAATATAALGLTRSIERRCWPFQHPLGQSNWLKPDMVYQLSRWADELEVHELADMATDDLATLCKVNARHADAIRQAARRFPSLKIDYKLKPLTYDLLRIDCEIKRDYEFDEHSTDSFYVWVEDEEGNDILQSKRIALHSQSVHVSFVIDPIALSATTATTDGISIRWLSEHWLGSEDAVYISFSRLRMADPPTPSTELLDLQLLQTALCCADMGVAGEAIAQTAPTLNALQTQAFFALTDSTANVIYATPHRAGRSLMVHMALCRAVQKANAGTFLVLHPTEALARKALATFKKVAIGITVLLAEKKSDLQEDGHHSPRVIFSTPHLIEAALERLSISGLNMVVLEDVHLLNIHNELSISLLRKATLMMDTRWIATSTSLENSIALQSWLDVEAQYVFNFGAKHRPTALRTTVVPFDLSHSLHLLKSMIKPAYDRIRQTLNGSTGQAMVFVPSRAQALTVARDLVRHAASEMDVFTVNDALEPYLVGLQDRSLGELLMAGVGVVNDTIADKDRKMMLALYSLNAIRILVVSREACWTLPTQIHCRCVIIMGTQFMRLDEAQIQLESLLVGRSARAGPDKRSRSRYARLVDYPISDVIRMQSYAAAPRALTDQDQGPNDCFVLCQNDQAALLRRMLDAGMLLESNLLEENVRDRSTIYQFVLHQVSVGQVSGVDDLTALLGWTFARYKMRSNPYYYGIESATEGQDLDGEAQLRLKDKVAEVCNDLVVLQCIEQLPTSPEDQRSAIRLTTLGKAIVHYKRSSVNLVIRLVALQERYAEKPQGVAQALLRLPAVRLFEVHKLLQRNSVKETNVVQLVLRATRQCTPGELLARFEVPRAPKDDGKEAEEDMTEEAIKGLLLALFLSQSQHTVRTPSEARQIKAKSIAKKNAKLQRAEAGASAIDGDREAGEATGEAETANESRCQRAKEALTSLMYTLVHSVLAHVDG